MKTNTSFKGNRRGNNNNRRGFSSRNRNNFRNEEVMVKAPTKGEIEHLIKLGEQAIEEKNGFSSLNLDLQLLGALKSLNFENPTPIQNKSIPIALDGKDILGNAQTGTGKTLAFLVPILNLMRTSPEKSGKSLILVPTRELGLQIETVVKELTKKLGLGLPVVLIGGVSYTFQFRMLKQLHRFIIATPGRLIDHLQQGNINLDDVDSLVLDEADRMLDIGFKPQLNEILTYLKEERQTMMFTATVSKDVRALIHKYLKNPDTVSVGETTKPNQNITQKIIEINGSMVVKNETLLDLLKDLKGTALIFTNTQVQTERISDYLAEFGIKSTPIHGGLSQGQRKRALESFRKEHIHVLVATDVAARGLDIDHVSLVINYDLPQVIEDYIHRIGRTGRAGRKGIAISLVNREQQRLWQLIARKYTDLPTAPARESSKRPFKNNKEDGFKPKKGFKSKFSNKKENSEKPNFFSSKKRGNKKFNQRNLEN